MFGPSHALPGRSYLEAPPYTRIVESPKTSRSQSLAGVAVILMSVLALPAPAVTATGQYEVYCDGVGVFLDKVDSVPASGRLVLFYRVPFPPGTFASYIGQGKWRDVYVFPKGCVPDGKCESIAIGKVRIDQWDAEETEDRPPKRISGKYEIDLNGKHLEGQFIAAKSRRTHAERVCM